MWKLVSMGPLDELQRFALRDRKFPISPPNSAVTAEFPRPCTGPITTWLWSPNARLGTPIRLHTSTLKDHKEASQNTMRAESMQDV